MDDNSSKSELLKQLKIDRSEGSEVRNTGANKWLLAGLALAIVLIVLLLLQSFFRGKSDDMARNLDAAANAKKTSAEAGVEEGTDAGTEALQKQQTLTSPNNEGSASLNASGYITARRIATVSAEILGLITEVRVDEGMAVEGGQILARLDATVAQVNLDLARAQVQVQEALLQSRQADLDEALRIRERVSGLTRGSFASDADITLAQANLEKARAALAASRADIEVARINVRQQQAFYDKHTIRAPFSGIVIGKNAQPGEIVSPSSAGGGFTRTGICTIVDMDSLEVEVDVNEAFIRRVRAGQKVIANLDAYPNWDIPAAVIAVIPAANRAKATVRVRIGFNLKDERILPDMGVKVAFY